MANVLVEEQTLKNIANTLRSCSGNSKMLKPADMPTVVHDVYNNGYDFGETIGYDWGWDDGYDVGYEEGQAEGGGSIELPALTGDLSYAFAGGTWKWFVDFFGDDVKTQDITTCYRMFYYYPHKELPNIKFNFKKDGCSFKYFFSYAKKIERINNIFAGTNVTPTELSYMFEECSAVVEIDKDIFNTMNIEAGTKIAWNNMFSYCRSLRELPDLSRFNDVLRTSTTSSTIYNYGFNNCFVLNEIKDLPVNKENATTNLFSSTFNYCKRLKDVTFVTDNGDPIAVDWRKQTIDLTSYLGFATGATDTGITNYGITQDKFVGDSASFEALKDDPDWYGNLEFARYNIDSAIRTIASLPDVSAGTSNVIKFKGEAGSGSASDGRKINEMTEEEIAVATAKGWTVTFV